MTFVLHVSKGVIMHENDNTWVRGNEVGRVTHQQNVIDAGAFDFSRTPAMTACHVTDQCLV